MTYSEIVERIIKENPNMDDKHLCYLVYQEICKSEGEHIFIPFNLWKKLPAFETISRTRRKLNQEKETKAVDMGIILTKQMSPYTYPGSWMAA